MQHYYTSVGYFDHLSFQMIVVLASPLHLTSQSYRSVSWSIIHSSRFSLFLNSFRSYFTVTLPCFRTGVSGSSVPGGVWKYTRGCGLDSGLVTAAIVRQCPLGTVGANSEVLFSSPRRCAGQSALKRRYKCAIVLDMQIGMSFDNFTRLELHFKINRRYMR